MNSRIVEPLLVALVFLLGACGAVRHVPVEHAVGWRRDASHSPENVIAGDRVTRAPGPSIYEFPNLGTNLVTWSAVLTPNHPKMVKQMWFEYWDGSSWRRIDYAPVPDGLPVRTLVRLPPSCNRLYVTMRSPTSKVESLELALQPAGSLQGMPNEKLLPRSMTTQRGIEMEPGFQGWTRLYRGMRLCQSFVAERDGLDGVTLKYQFERAWTVIVRLREDSSAGAVLAEASKPLQPISEWRSVDIPVSAGGLAAAGTYVLEVLGSGVEGSDFVKIGERYDNPYENGFAFELFEEDNTGLSSAVYAERYSATHDLDITLHYRGGLGLSICGDDRRHTAE